MYKRQVGISVEPCRRDTFPAIALAAAYLKDVKGISEDEPVVVCPVDPYVEIDYFDALKDLGAQAASSNANLVLMGIEPTYPSEKYGYIIPDTPAPVSTCLLYTSTVMTGPIILSKEDSSRLRPVSYTHLDAYKRQVHMLPSILTTMSALWFFWDFGAH